MTYLQKSKVLNKLLEEMEIAKAMTTSLHGFVQAEGRSRLKEVKIAYKVVQQLVVD